MKRILLLITLILISWIPSSGQSLLLEGDTVKCYSLQDLREIVHAVVRGEECESLLILTEEQLSNASHRINVMKSMMDNKDAQISLQENMLKDYDSALTIATDMYKKERLKHKMTKVKWGTTTAILLVLSGILIVY